MTVDALQVKSMRPTRDHYGMSMVGSHRRPKRYLREATSCQIANSLRGKEGWHQEERGEDERKSLEHGPGTCGGEGVRLRRSRCGVVDDPRRQARLAARTLKHRHDDE